LIFAKHYSSIDKNSKMKKRILLFTAVAGISYLVFSSESGGPATSLGGNRTGSQGSTTTCGTVGAGCHGGTGAATTVTITVDSATTHPVTHYVPGQTYTINITGTNSSSYAKFGFEFSSVSGTGVSQIQAGTPVTSSLPTHVFADALSGLTIVEHGAALTAAVPGNYTISFQWTAPTTGVGNITLYATLNAVNGNAVADAADVSANTSVVLGQEAKPTSVATANSSVNVSAFPNPVSNVLNLKMDNAETGTYSIKAFSVDARCVAAENISVNGNSQTATINTSNWTPGMYMVDVEKDGVRKVVQVVKQ
jgi:type IX secretion system substrate protein